MHRSTKFLIAIVIVLGIFFRVVNLDQKLMSGDESITQVRAAGYKGESYGVDAYKGPSVAKLLPRDQVITVGDIGRFQTVQTMPTPFDTLRTTATGAPQHTPLYWLLIRFWMQAFGNSVAAVRSLSVIFSVLAFPALYWLCWELFSSATVSWIAVALMAVSPVHIFQAQNARPYSLWILMMLVSSAALIRALKSDQRQKRVWLAYGITLAFSLYTYLFSFFVLIAHGIYVFCREGFSKAGLTKNKALKNYCLTTGWVVLAFSPWILVVLTNWETANEMTAWTATPVDSLVDLMWSYVKNLLEIFLYWNIQFDAFTPLNESSSVFLLGTAAVIFSIYAFYFLYKYSPNQAWIFVFALTSTTVLSLMAADFLIGGRRAALNRYLYPSILGIQLAVAYCLGTKLKTSLSWRVLVIAVFFCGVISSAAGAHSQTWRGHPDFSIQSAQIINQAERPLVISDRDIVYGLMPLNTRLSPQVNWLLVSQPDNVQIPSQFSDIFVYRASKALQDALKESYTFEAVYEYAYPGSFIWDVPRPSVLWKLDSVAS